jgi:hypothetical protein
VISFVVFILNTSHQFIHDIFGRQNIMTHAVGWSAVFLQVTTPNKRSLQYVHCVLAYSVIIYRHNVIITHEPRKKAT